MRSLKIFITKISFWLLVLVLFTACSNPSTEVEDTDQPILSTSTPTVPTITATTIPAAAIVNGEPLPLSWYENELSQYLQAKETMGEPVDDLDLAKEVVIEDLIDQFLLAQAAQDAGIIIDDTDVQERIDALRQEVDLDSWMNEWGYTPESLAQSLRYQLLSAKQRDEILAEIPELVDQVELQQIFAYTQEGARNALGSLNAGTSFEEVAFVYDPLAGGYLGWVPAGYLLIPEIEQAAFSLPVEAYSEIIESDIGYHIIKVLAREQRELTSDALLTLQRKALRAWLSEKRAESTIEVLID